MADTPDESFILAFVGHADAAMSDRAAAYEDEVLPLLEQHGARVLYRGRRARGQNASLPLEVHLIWFPRRGALASYMADPLRLGFLKKYGDVFTAKEVVELESISEVGLRRPASGG